MSAIPFTFLSVIGGIAQLIGGQIDLSFLAVYLVFLLLPTILYILTAVFLKQRKEWSITSGIVAASIHLTIAVIGFLASVCLLFSSMFFTVYVIFSGVWIASLLEFIIHLRKAKLALRLEDHDHQRGFEVPVQKIREDV